MPTMLLMLFQLLPVTAADEPAGSKGPHPPLVRRGAARSSGNFRAPGGVRRGARRH